MTPFRLPTRVVCAAGARTHLPDIIQRHGCGRILLTTDRGLSATPWPAAIEAMLVRTGCRVLRFEGIEPNPRAETIDEMAGQARAGRVEAVVGLGGGSVLDAGKAAAMLLRNPGSCMDYEGRNRCSGGSAPFIAIPTTCGTGSEVTWVSVVTDPSRRRKVSVKGDAMFPSDALIDADLLATLPAHLIAYTGMDAYTHAIEAYTCNRRNPVSDALAEKAIELLDAFLLRAYSDITDEEARFEVMRAATLAGMAFGNADVAAVHCLSESIGGMWDVPHGLANAVLLVPVLSFHRSVVEHRLATLYRRLVAGARGDEELLGRRMIDRIRRLVQALDIPGFASLGIPPDEYPAVAVASVENNSNASNPQPMDEAAYLAILHGAGR